MTDKTISIPAPEMTMEQYAELIGVTYDTLDGWCNRGYIPTFRVGKYKMINVAARMMECLQKEQDYHA